METLYSLAYQAKEQLGEHHAELSEHGKKVFEKLDAYLSKINVQVENQIDKDSERATSEEGEGR